MGFTSGCGSIAEALRHVMQAKQETMKKATDGYQKVEDLIISRNIKSHG